MKIKSLLTIKIFLSFCCTLLVFACSTETSDRTGSIQVTTTTAQVADLVRNVGQDHVEVTALMGPGVDPHLYKASQGDVAKLRNAEIIFYNGLNLEGRMEDIFVKMKQSGKPTVAVSSGIETSNLIDAEDYVGQSDPHIWMDASLWANTIPVVIEELSKLRPEYADLFQANGEAYQQKMNELHQYALDQIATIPKEQRVLVTAHDAFVYFGQAYDIEVMGLQGISTASEMGLMDLQNLVDIISNRNVQAVFVESSVPRRNIEALIEGCKANGHEVQIGGELFSDAMGEAGTPEATYEGMFKHNVDTITESLKD